MADFPVQKIAISGPTLASLMQRISSSLGDVDGLLFGHVAHIAPSTLSDDDSPRQIHASDSDSPQLVANITSFLCFISSLSFYDSLGRVDSLSLHRFLSTSTVHHHHFVGWFSARRKTPIRPSMREFSVTRSLSSQSDLSLPIKNSDSNITNPVTLTPCFFLLFTTPLQDQVIHTHDYRAYQYRVSMESLEPKPIDVVNIGPAFRGHYGSFIPNAPFPLMSCDVRGGASAMNVEERERESEVVKQREMDLCADGYRVGDLRRLLGSESTTYTANLEDLYEKMLVKIENLARQVEVSNAKVLEQENHNRKLRYKLARAGLE